MNLALLASALLASHASGTDGLVDPTLTKSRAMAFEKQLDWDHALAAWESILDRAEPSDALRFEAVSHVHDLILRVKPENSSLRSGKAWPTIVVIYRNVSVVWKDGSGQAHHFVSHFNDREIQSIHKGFDTFCSLVFRFTKRQLRIEPTFRVVDQPVTSLEGKDGFWLGTGIRKQTFLNLMKGVDYQSVFSYEKFSEGDQKLPRAFAGGTYGGDQGLNGAAFSEILWDGGEETDGEVELHEWLHQIDWMFTTVLGYPHAASVSPDMGRRVGETEGDPDYRRPPSSLNWLDFYRHIMEDHITRKMWQEAAMHYPKPNPWLTRKG